MTCCPAGLGSNPELVYALLHRAEVFESIRLHDRFADVLQPIQVGILCCPGFGCTLSNVVTCCSLHLLVQVVTDTFSQHIEDARAADPAWEESVAAVMSVIKAGLKRWKPLDNLPGANSFTYEEESEQPQAFFIPYCWTLVISGTTIPFNLPSLRCFLLCLTLMKGYLTQKTQCLKLGMHSMMCNASSLWPFLGKKVSEVHSLLCSWAQLLPKYVGLRLPYICMVKCAASLAGPQLIVFLNGTLKTQYCQQLLSSQLAAVASSSAE